MEFKGQCAADDDVAVVDHEVGDTQTTSLHNSLHHDSNASRKPSNLMQPQNSFNTSCSFAAALLVAPVVEVLAVVENLNFDLFLPLNGARHRPFKLLHQDSGVMTSEHALISV